MASRVAVYQRTGNLRSKRVAAAMMAGVAKNGDRPFLRDASMRGIHGDIAVFYGFDASLQRVYREYRSKGLQVVYVDLGYWGRKQGGKLSGYHKICVNDRHPTAYFQHKKHDDTRFSAFNLKIKRWQTGMFVLLAGMSEKSAVSEGFKPHQWELNAIENIRKYTDRPIIYRPKPSWKNAVPIPGAEFLPGHVDMELLFENCHAVVTHHSNVAVDSLVSGVPSFCEKGAASSFVSSDLSRLESPERPDGREQLFADIAWCQWNMSEIADGKAWRHLKNEGLIP